MTGELAKEKVPPTRVSSSYSCRLDPHAVHHRAPLGGATLTVAPRLQLVGDGNSSNSNNNTTRAMEALGLVLATPVAQLELSL